MAFPVTREDSDTMENYRHALYGKSVYTARPEDPCAVYLTPENFPVKGDGIADDTDAIQEAILQVQNKSRYGIVFIPEGTYRITRTIYIGKACRLIGYGKNRPTFVLGKNTPGFQKPDPKDKGQGCYMFWFADRVPNPGEGVRDANPGTFYSAISNINIRIEDGNPAAVALRTHYAQNCYISHCDIHIGNGKAGIFDAGNEIEDVRFFGGDYGIYTTKPSPGWPFLMVDTYFGNQRKAAVRSRETGLTVVRMQAENVPVVFETEPGHYEKLYVEDSIFKNVSDAALVVSCENNSNNQINLRNVSMLNVPKLAYFRESRKTIPGKGRIYTVKTFVHGKQMDDLGLKPETKSVMDIEETDGLLGPALSDIPPIPDTNEWVNIKNLGAKGDGIADDTEVFRNAIEKHRTIYLPQGFYRVTDTIRLKPGTVLIGLNPISTRIMISDNTESFGGFGPPKPLLDVPENGCNIVTGIGIDTGARNPRAVGCRWMAGPDSYMNDIKFLGGHGGMNPDGSHVRIYNETRTADANSDLKWDSQYWSLWITNGGGGVFKDIWTASPYAQSGMYVSDTSARGRIYAMSVEHHVRNEVRFKNVSNWKVYALQFEEEVAEGPDCQPLDMENCENIMFANLYFFRVIWVCTPYPQSVRTFGCRNIEFLNIHNFAQTKYAFGNFLYDTDTGLEIRPWEASRVYLAGKSGIGSGSSSGRYAQKNSNSECDIVSGINNVTSKSFSPYVSIYRGKHPESETSCCKAEKVAGGFEMADAVCRDSKNNIYFVDSRLKRVYRWSEQSKSLSLITDIHYKPLSVACDTEDNLLVVCEYAPPVGATVNGRPEVYTNGPDAQGTSYSFWYRKGATVKVYSINPDKPETTMKVLDKVPVTSVKEVFKALHPANRWRDGHDFLSVSVNRPEYCYVAPDGRTIIPDCYDLMRAVCLIEAFPGKPAYAVDEYLKRTVRFDVTEHGFLTDPVTFAEHGETNVLVSSAGDVYIPDGQIYVYGPDGYLKGEITIPERPGCVIFGDSREKNLFVTARSSLYRVSL